MINSRKNEITLRELKKKIKIIGFSSNNNSKYELIYFLIFIFLTKTKNCNTYLKKKYYPIYHKNLY